MEILGKITENIKGKVVKDVRYQSHEGAEYLVIIFEDDTALWISEDCWERWVDVSFCEKWRTAAPGQFEKYSEEA